MTADNITIVVPLDLKRRSISLVSRIVRLAEACGPAGMRLVIGHADRSTIYDKRLIQFTRRHSHVKVLSTPEPSQLPNLSRLRNIAAEAADDGVLLFLDADIAPDIGVFQALAKQVFEGSPFAMAPCLYLSDAGTRRLKGGTPLPTIIKNSLSFSPFEFMHWAFPSSVMAMRREDFFKVDGFYEGYIGHGYEDFDFMLRLALQKKLVTPSFDLLVDRPYRAPLLAEGFRSALGALCLPNLLQGNVAAHLFHPRDSMEGYYGQRQINAKLFHERMGNHLASLDTPLPSLSIPPMVSAFFEECAKHAIAPAKYYALFDDRPRHLLARTPWLKRMGKHLMRRFA